MAAVNQTSSVTTYEWGSGFFEAARDITMLATRMDTLATKLNADAGVTDTNYVATQVASLVGAPGVNAPGTVQTVEPAMQFRRMIEDIVMLATRLDTLATKLNADAGVTDTNYVATQVASLRSSLSVVNIPGTAFTYNWADQFRFLAVDVVMLATRMDTLATKLNADGAGGGVIDTNYVATQVATLTTSAP